MRKAIIFVMTSLDGYFEGSNGDLSWHNVDAEFNDFAAEQLDEADILLFGRKTYELMAGYWPSDTAVTNDPIIAGMMNSKPKIVFSKSMDKAEWNNTRLLSDVGAGILELKEQPGKDLLILGSANLAVSLIEQKLIDEFRIMVNPVVLGDGAILFDGIKDRHKLKLLNIITFKSGNVLLNYTPANES
jgi:dihydrofolate reductase